MLKYCRLPYFSLSSFSLLSFDLIWFDLIEIMNINRIRLMWCDDHRSVSVSALVSFEMLLFLCLSLFFIPFLRRFENFHWLIFYLFVWVCGRWSYSSRDKWFFGWNVENTDLINESKLFVYVMHDMRISRNYANFRLSIGWFFFMCVTRKVVSATVTPFKTI